MVLLQDSILVVACGYSRNTYFFYLYLCFITE